MRPTVVTAPLPSAVDESVRAVVPDVAGLLPLGLDVGYVVLARDSG
jgi:hypothetical protein